jgi:murein DD-endopeptidase MepM/ murein hydrolase activator NlpD
MALRGPPTTKASLSALAFPDDGSVVSAASATATAAVNLRHAAAAGLVSLSGVSVFGGEITADAISARAAASSGAAAVTGDDVGTTLENLVILGQPTEATPNLRVPLGDWGEAVVLESRAVPGTTYGVSSFRQSATALAIVLSADHGGLTAGTRVEIGSVAAFARVPLASRRSTRSGVTKVRPPRPAAPPAATKKPGQQAPAESYVPGSPDRLYWALGPATVFPAFDVNPRLTARRYVFPVYGPAGYGDTFGAARADTGWHHGDDIFAPLGAPVLAVTDGTVFSVGWNKLGGNRLWLRDRGGNEFYYAHLSAFSPLAVNGAEVEAGAVLGFVGNSGDADGTPYHLHFEIHPTALLFLGYDGVVDPTPFLDAWRRLKDLHFPAGVPWAPAVAPRSSAPMPGAILLQSRDISSASGLDPASLERVLAPVPSEGGGIRAPLDAGASRASGRRAAPVP